MARDFDAVRLLAAGAVMGVLGDWLARAPGPLGLNAFVWITLVAAAAVVLSRQAAVSQGAALPLEVGRAAWLAIGVGFAAGLAWRDSPILKLVALACATLAFAIAAHQASSAWVRRAGVVRYAWALALGALHAWTAPALVLVEAMLSARDRESRRASARRSAMAVLTGLVVATPLVLLFGALFMAADVVFAELVANAVRVDFERVAGHVLLFSTFGWLSTGYLRGFLAGTEPRVLAELRRAVEERAVPGAGRPTLGSIEIGTALAAVDLLFLLFVIVQFRYLFGSDAVVQITPGLTYAEYARQGFFELVAAVVLVVPVLLAADWLAARPTGLGAVIFRLLAGLQIALVLAIAASALQRLRLYHASYGLTEDRFYAMVLLLWMGGLLVWLAATVLRGRRELFAFGALGSGLATAALLFSIAPDAIIARTNVRRMAQAATQVRFDVVYATTLSADAVPDLVAALHSLPPDAQCPLARHMLGRWGPERERSWRNWNWSAARARHAVHRHEAALRTMADSECRNRQ